MPFVKPEDMVDTLRVIICQKWPMGFAEDDPNLIAFIDYYGEYWMEGMNGLTLDDWNVYSVDDHRTSSHVNSMHRVLTSLIEPHPNI